MGEKNQAIAAAELEKHFKLPIWMHALTATDANRYSISIARTVTGRRNVAIPNFTYHGTLEVTQKIMPEPGVIARFHEMPQYFADVEHGTKIFTWNDLDSVEECLKDRTVAILLLEPVMSNFGWAWPEEGFLEGVRELTKKYGTLLCYDETHTLSYDWNGYCGAHDLDYDMWTCGKAISSGIPGAVFGMTREIGDLIQEWHNEAGFFAGAGLGFLGNVLTGNTLSTVALKVTLEEVLTPEVYGHLKGLGSLCTSGNGRHPYQIWCTFPSRANGQSHLLSFYKRCCYRAIRWFNASSLWRFIRILSCILMASRYVDYALFQYVYGLPTTY